MTGPILHYELLEFLVALNATASVEEAWRLSTTFMRGLGAGQFSIRIGFEPERSQFKGTQPPWVMESYYERVFPECDLRLEHCRRNVTPYFYGKGFWHHEQNLPAPRRYFDEEIVDADMRTVVAVPVHTASKRTQGLFALGTGFDTDEFVRMYNQQGTMIHMAGTGAFNRLSSLLGEEKATAIGLSDRERECLLWLSRGFRYDQIAHRIGLCPATVEYHLARARRKLNARTREQALVNAIQLNILEP